MKKANPLINDDSVLSILEIAGAYQKSKILLTSCELDIFTILGNDEKTAKEVAFEIDTDERATERLMNALCSINLLIKREVHFSNTKGTFRFLVKGQKEFIGNMMHKTNLWEAWSNLTDCIRKGSAVHDKRLIDMDEKWIESYTESIHWRASLQAPDIVKMVNIQNVKSILDLGGGSGVYAMEFLRAKPSLDITIFDLPGVIPFTKKHLSENDMDGLIKTTKGDLLEDDFGSGYDLIFISHLLNDFSIWQNIKIIKRVYDSLNNGGKIVIQEYIMNDDRISPERCAILSLNMLVNTQSGDSYTETDLWIMLKEAWFKNVKRIDTEFGTGLMIGEK